jgi:23S rRNA (guanosine2251-2'-O)-methyltransferase
LRKKLKGRPKADVTAPLILILHNLRSAHNVGSIFRTAEAVGVEKIFLTGYTPAPCDRFGRLNKEIAKTALGAEKLVPWERRASISLLLSYLKTKTHKLIALEQSPRAVDYREIKLTRPTAVIVGNEVRGLDRRILNQCDLIVEIPMQGRKESLNVSVAAGILLFHAFS